MNITKYTKADGPYIRLGGTGCHIQSAVWTSIYTHSYHSMPPQMAQPSGIPAFSSITFGVELEVPLLNNIENILRAGECADRKTRLRASAKLITPELEKAKIRYSTEFWDGTEEAIWVDHRRWHIGEDPTTYQPWTKGTCVPDRSQAVG